jgi:hypothetical protein
MALHQPAEGEDTRSTRQILQSITVNARLDAESARTSSRSAGGPTAQRQGGPFPRLPPVRSIGREKP